MDIRHLSANKDIIITIAPIVKKNRAGQKVESKG